MNGLTYEDLLRQALALEMAAQAQVLNARVFIATLKAMMGPEDAPESSAAPSAKDPETSPEAPKASPPAEEPCPVGCKTNYRVPANNPRSPRATRCRMCKREHD